MARLIDADALLPMMKYATTDSEIGVFPIKISFNTIAKVIDDTPTIDAVEVIRCKDCIWNREKEWVDCYMSGMHGRNINNFCSQGKRREE